MPHTPGRLVLVVGPSGTGKDTVLDGAKERLGDTPSVLFPKREITRPADAGGEDHIPVSEDVFLEKQSSNAYLLSWQAHGLAYGIPRTIENEMALGKIVVVNASRTIIDDAREVLPGTEVILITAPPSVRAARLASRGRETADQIAPRLSRQVALEAERDDVWTVSNDAKPEQAINRFLDILSQIQHQPRGLTQDTLKHKVAG